jgi:hypothetical protein
MTHAHRMFEEHGPVSACLHVKHGLHHESLSYIDLRGKEHEDTKRCKPS